MPAHDPTHVLVPVKAFVRAKARLAPALGPTERAELARAMATRVVHAFGDHRVWVVCDDDTVAAWARAQGASVSWQPGRGLNGAVSTAVAERFADGAGRVTVVHSDLPLLARFPDLDCDPGTVVLVPDRHGTGTNVVSTPTPTFRFAYGPASFHRHLAEIERLGLSARVVRDGSLGWDVDEPADLSVFDLDDPAADRAAPRSI